MWSVLVVVVEERADAFTARSAVVGGIQINVVVFECAPQSLDEDVVQGSSCPVH